jgi:hypothetical protein
MAHHQRQGFTRSRGSVVFIGSSRRDERKGRPLEIAGTFGKNTETTHNHIVLVMIPVSIMENRAWYLDKATLSS